MTQRARWARIPALTALLAPVALSLFIGVHLAAPAAAATSVSWSDQLAELSGARPDNPGRGVTVAVLDTWVEASHPDFNGRIESGATCTRGRCVAGADKPDTCEAHGTHVAGIVASTRYGVAPDAKVLPIRVLTDQSGTCSAEAADVALGIRYAIAHHAKIINVSLGSTYPLQDPRHVLAAAVSAASRAGDLVIVAAGNGKATAADTYGKDALTVAALGPDGQIAAYSQRGAGVDIAAPGGDPGTGTCNPQVCVVSTWKNGGYASDAGTSMAAPFVSGTAALLLSQDPKLSAKDLRTIILASAQPLNGGKPGQGAGRLDVLVAVRYTAVHATPAGAVKASSKVTLGPVQIVGLVVVGGVALALLAVTSERRRRTS